MNLLHRSNKLLIVGASGTGKTTYATRYLLACRDAQVFIYDHQGDIAPRLGSASLVDYDALVAAVGARQRFVCFDPVDLYPGELAAGFDFFCEFVVGVGGATPGRKIFVCDEVHMVTSTFADGLPWTFAHMLETGRKIEIDLVLVSQQPNLCHNRIRQQATEVVAFLCGDKSATEYLVNDCGFDPDEVLALREGEYICRDRRRGLQARGKLWVKPLPKKSLEKVLTFPAVSGNVSAEQESQRPAVSDQSDRVG